MTVIYILYALIGMALVGIDYAAKLHAFENLRKMGSIPIIDGVLHFTYCENTGAAFSMFTGKADILAIASVIVICFLVIKFIIDKPTSLMYITSMMLLVAGGTGNLIDRLMRGYVIDFIELRFIGFAIFNIADIYVCCGAALLILDFILQNRKAEKV